ncbi:MAG: hypothetical protein ACRDNW_18855 [Trebonia sp.]
MTTTPGPGDSPPSGESGSPRVTRRQRAWLTLAAVFVVAGCGFATWWQAQRALHGNLLSDFYAVMWPMYGCYAIYLWSRLCRGVTTLVGASPRPTPITHLDESDEETRAYNRYLAGKRADAQRRSG